MIILKCYLSYCSNVSPHSCSSLENLASLACRRSLETATSLSRRFLETSASLFRCSLESAASLSWTQSSQFWRFRFCWSSCHCCCWMSRSRSCCCCRSCRPKNFPFRLHHSPESPMSANPFFTSKDSLLPFQNRLLGSHTQQTFRSYPIAQARTLPKKKFQRVRKSHLPIFSSCLALPTLTSTLKILSYSLLDPG